MGLPEPVKLRLIPVEAHSAPRTIIRQRDAGTPVFCGEDSGGHSLDPDWECGHCGNILATKMMWHSVETECMRFLPFPQGGEFSSLSYAVPVGRYLASVGGRMVVQCASCGSLNETVPSTEG